MWPVLTNQSAEFQEKLLHCNLFMKSAQKSKRCSVYMLSDVLFKWAIPGLFFVNFRLFKQRSQFLQQIFKNVHTLYGAGIWTNNLQDVSLLP